jgi:excisionase family DNA binding protein
MDERSWTERSGEWLTVTQAATRLGVSERTVQRRCKSGKLVARRMGDDKGTIWLVAWPPQTTGINDGEATYFPSGGDTSATNSTINDDAASTSNDADIARIQGYVARDLELMLSRAIVEAQAPLLERIEALMNSNQVQTAHMEALAKEIEQLAAVQAAQMAEAAALRREVELMAITRMAAQLAAPPIESVAEGGHKMPEAVTEEATDKSPDLNLKQVQEMSDEVDLLQAENERLRFELEKTQRPWWKKFFFDP